MYERTEVEGAGRHLVLYVRLYYAATTLTHPSTSQRPTFDAQRATRARSPERFPKPT